MLVKKRAYNLKCFNLFILKDFVIQTFKFRLEELFHLYYHAVLLNT